LKSIIEQTSQPSKLLVIDDGSSDGSPDVIASVLKDCPFDCELIVRENRGLCATLNQAFSLSSGDYFAYLGSDDFWLPGFLEARARLLDSRPEAVLGYGHAYFVDGKGDVFDSTAEHKEHWAQYPDGDARQMLLDGIAPVSSTVFYRRAALEKVRWNERSRLEDYEMYLNLMQHGHFAFDPRVLSAWRHHGYNTSGDRKLMLAELLAAQDRNFDILSVGRDELARVQTRTKFRYARDELQHGNKMDAIRLARESWRGASSKTELTKFFVRMFVPMSVVELRRRRRKDRLKAAISNIN
jgi:glycosyltransferase involved in cell wall biosynthesis